MSTLMEELTAIKAVEDKLTANKVANFAYTDHAYNNPLTEADGVETYNVDNEQNIPVANASILKVNTTILTKGWRAQASAITRMLMNHFLGRCSYNLNKINDLFSLLLTKFMAFLGSPNGIATLDANGRIPYSQLPESAIELKGYWDADTNTPTLADGTGTNGDEYLVSVAGTQDLGSGSQYFGVGDRVVYTGGVWKNISSGFVRTVNTVAPDAQGEVKTVLGTNTFPVTRSFLGAVFGRLLGRAWYEGTGIGNTISTQIPVYANGIWVCTSNDYGIWWSEDGKAWTQGVVSESIPSGSYGKRLIYANGLWLCGMSRGGLWWSEDGKNWTLATGDDISNTSNISEIIYANGLWLCTGEWRFWWSEDGKNWTQITGTIASSMLATCILVYANGIYVCGNSAGLWWSEDGKSWFSGSGGLASDVYCITYANGLWVCGSKSNGLWWSEDGKAWTQGTGASTTTYGIPNVVYGNGLWVCGTLTHGSAYSTNGKTWTAFSGDSSTLGATVTALVYSDGVWVAGLGVSTQGVYWSLSGKSWTKANVIPETINSEVKNIVYANGVFICATLGRGLVWSEDGINWHKVRGLGDIRAQYPAYGNGMWVCGSGSHGIWYSDSIEDLIAEGTINLEADVPIVSD